MPEKKSKLKGHGVLMSVRDREGNERVYCTCGIEPPFKSYEELTQHIKTATEKGGQMTF